MPSSISTSSAGCLGRVRGLGAHESRGYAFLTFVSFFFFLFLFLFLFLLRGFGTERARLGTFRGFETERARLGTLRGFGTERARLGVHTKVGVTPF